MFLNFFLPCFLFFSLPSWVFANTCEEGFSSGEVFISFIKKRIRGSVEKELKPNWSKKIIKKTKHWTRTEALQFLDFLINRIGEKETLQKLIFFPDFPNTGFNDFIKKIPIYDQINKEIITAILTEHIIPISLFLQAENIRKIQKIYPLMESYIGKQGAIYLLIDLHKVFFKTNPNETRKVIDFINDYTKKHALITDTLNNRVDYFRQFISYLTSPPFFQVDISDIKFSNFRELKEFSKLILKKSRKLHEKRIETKKVERETTETPQNNTMEDVVLMHTINTKIASMFVAYSKAKLRNLKKTVAILEQYIKPEEVASIMMNSTEIYSVNPKHLKKVINILKKAHSVSIDSSITEAENKLKTMITMGPEYLSILNKVLTQPTPPTINLKELINFIMKKNIDSLLSANPTYLKNTITILNTYFSKEMVALILHDKTDWHQQLHSDLLQAAKSKHLQKVITFIEKFLKKDEINYIITRHYLNTTHLLPKIWIRKSAVFIKIVGILKSHIDQKSVLLRLVKEIIEIDSFLISELHDDLVKMNDTLDHNTMKKLLTEVPILELSPQIQELKLMISDKTPSDPSSLH